MDGANDNIAEHFKNIYSRLYNSVDDASAMAWLSSNVEYKINDISLKDVDKISPKLIKETSSKLKLMKSDPVYSFSSDCIKVESDSLVYLHSVIIKSYLILGHITRKIRQY